MSKLDTLLNKGIHEDIISQEWQSESEIWNCLFHKLSGFRICNFSVDFADSYKNPKPGICDISVHNLSFFFELED